MKIVYIILLILTCISIKAFGYDNRIFNPVEQCISSDRIIKPTDGWLVIKNEINYKNNKPFIEIVLHNPLNVKNSKSIDARFVISLDSKLPFDTKKYKLSLAIFYNEDSIVTFKPIYLKNPLKIKSTEKNDNVRTECFSRNVVLIKQNTSTNILKPLED